MKRIATHVTGKVQGVFYRAHTEKTARRIGLRGFVRNEDDGSVYIEAQGTQEQLDELVEWCKRGPDRAVVKDVVVKDLSIGTETSFSIHR